MASVWPVVAWVGTVYSRWAKRCLAFGPPFLVFAVLLAAGVAGIPHEDSAIVYSYSRSLGVSGAISYFPGGEVTEGATPLLWMLMLAVSAPLGVDPHLLANLLNIVACGLLAFCAIVVLGRGASIESVGEENSGKSSGTLFFLFIFFGVVLLSGVLEAPQFGFSTLFFAAMLVAASVSLWSGRLVAFSACGVLAFLIRPDGIVYVAAIGVSDLLFSLWSSRRRSSAFTPVSVSVSVPVPVSVTLRYRVLALAAIALAFALFWTGRAQYFGNDFPLPYYVKSGQSLTSSLGWVGGVVAGDSAFKSRVLLSTVLLAALFAMHWVRKRRPEVGKRPLATLRPFFYAVAFLGAGILYLSRYHLFQNIGHRFEAVAFLFVLFWFCVSAAAFYSVFKRGVAWATAGLFVLVIVTTPPLALLKGLGGSVFYARVDNVRHLAGALSIASRDAGGDVAGHAAATLMVTEAGKFPYYSGFDTIDAWGLNTARYSKMPLTDPKDVAEWNPTLIALHGKTRYKTLEYLCKRPKLRARRNWTTMTHALVLGAVDAPSEYAAYAMPLYLNLDGTPAIDGKRRDLLMIRADAPRFSGLEAAVISHGAKPLGPIKRLFADPERCRAVLSKLRSTSTVRVPPLDFFGFSK
jgi:hypothetical protein